MLVSLLSTCCSCDHWSISATEWWLHSGLKGYIPGWGSRVELHQWKCWEAWVYRTSQYNCTHQGESCTTEILQWTDASKFLALIYLCIGCLHSCRCWMVLGNLQHVLSINSTNQSPHKHPRLSCLPCACSPLHKCHPPPPKGTPLLRHPPLSRPPLLHPPRIRWPLSHLPLSHLPLRLPLLSQPALSQEHFQPQISHLVSNRTDHCLHCSIMLMTAVHWMLDLAWHEWIPCAYAYLCAVP